MKFGLLFCSLTASMDIPLHKNESAKKFKRDWNKIAESQFRKQFKNFVQEPEPIP